jgi:hypothetical protein
MLSSLSGALNRPRSPSVQSTVRLAIHSTGKMTAPKPGDDRTGRRPRLRRHRRRDRLYWRPADYGRVAGRTYIAWCLAAVRLPVLTGYLFDMTREYSTAVLIAAGANVAHGDGPHDAETRLAGGRLTALAMSALLRSATSTPN